MPVFGPNSAVDNALPSGVDGNVILQWTRRDGRSAAQIIADAAGMIGEANTEIFSRYSALLTETQELQTYYRKGNGVRRRTPKKTEFKKPTPIRGQIAGHMLPLNYFEDATAWTPEWLMDASMEVINATLQEITDSWKTGFDLDIWTRAFSMTENPVGAGYDVPWAVGAGVTPTPTMPFTPPQNGLYPFDDTHTHFQYVPGAVSGTTVASGLEKIAEELRHHGHIGMLVAYVSDQDVAAYNAITGKKWVKYIPTGVQVVSGTEGPVFVSQKTLEGTPGEAIGVYLSDIGPQIVVKTHETIPTGYQFGTKSYGTNNPKNGLALREHPQYGFGLVLDPMLTTSINPKLSHLEFDGAYGVGTNDRLNGVAVYIANGATAYVEPDFGTDDIEEA